MINSLGKPSVRGRRSINSGSPLDIAAAVCTTSPPDAPLVMVAAGAPISRAISRPAAIRNSSIWTNTGAIASMALTTSGNGRLPECMVFGPPALITGVTPNSASMPSPRSELFKVLAVLSA